MSFQNQSSFHDPNCSIPYIGSCPNSLLLAVDSNSNQGMPCMPKLNKYESSPILRGNRDPQYKQQRLYNNYMHRTARRDTASFDSMLPQYTLMHNYPYSQHGNKFPSFFNPRTASNMPHKEKVNNWMENIPIFELEDGVWETYCYANDYPIDWEESEFDSTTSTHALVTKDEILELQAKKLDTLVRKLYFLEKDPPSDDTEDRGTST